MIYRPPLREPLTQRQAEVFNFICDYVGEFYFPPTVREVAEGVGLLSSSSAHAHMRALERKGWIEWPHGREMARRAYRVVGLQPMVLVPDRSRWAG